MYKLVRCPCCWKFQQDLPKVPVYVCGGCNAILIVKEDKNGRVVPEHDREILVAHMDFAKKAEIYGNNMFPHAPKVQITEETERCYSRYRGKCRKFLMLQEIHLMIAYVDAILPNSLKIPLQAIKDCTHDFNERNYLGKGGYGRVYKGILMWADNVNQLVAVKRLDVKGGQGNKEFHTELTMRSQYQHENIIALIGFCVENKEMIIVYEYASHGSLDTYLCGTAMSIELTWPQLLKICIDVASALDCLHNHVAEKHRIIHRDIKSANILLDENWNAKLADFGLSTIGLANQSNTFVITNRAGTTRIWTFSDGIRDRNFP
ncbi:hypothetical protein LXL04_033724 [Taraxacum kok-saghyz]